MGGSSGSDAFKGASGPIRVLLVDDDESIRKSYSKLLVHAGCEVVTAVDGVAAIEILKEAEFDVILTDIRMPGISGTEFLKAVRAVDLDIPVILMTGSPDVASSVEAVEYGAFRYLIKPVNFEELGNITRTASEFHRLAKLKRMAFDSLDNQSKQLGDRASLESRFSLALEAMWMAYQPIVKPMEKAVFAYEALLRSDEPSLRSPMDILEASERLGRTRDLSRAIRARVASDIRKAPADSLIFLNLHSEDFEDPELYSDDGFLSVHAHRIVLEVTERAALSQTRELTERVEELRSLGYRFAIDDLGAGYAGLNSFTLLKPEVVKLDMSLVRNIHTERVKQKLVGSMTTLCQELRMLVVAEGVETEPESKMVQSLGCGIQQGYYFAKPSAEFLLPSWS